MDEQTLCWLAGLFEGEGYFSYGVPTEPNAPRVVLTMKDEDIVARVAALFNHSYTPITPSKSHWSITYRFVIRNEPGAQLMKQLYPLMGQRRQTQIDKALAHYHPKEHPTLTRNKITEEQVLEIKKRLATGETAKSIAQDFPISHYAIWDIRSGKTWGFIDIEKPPSKQPPIKIVNLDTEENRFHWLVGILEAEGSFMAGPPSAPNIPRISLPSTDEDVVARAAEICGCNYQALRSRNENHKNVFRLYIKGSKAVELMKRLYPHMGQRRQAQINKVFDSYSAHTPRHGVEMYSAKINEEEAREIKRRALSGENVEQIAADFKVSISIVREIKYGRTWKHITV